MKVIEMVTAACCTLLTLFMARGDGKISSEDALVAVEIGIYAKKDHLSVGLSVLVCATGSNVLFMDSICWSLSWTMNTRNWEKCWFAVFLEPESKRTVMISFSTSVADWIWVLCITSRLVCLTSTRFWCKFCTVFRILLMLTRVRHKCGNWLCI